MTITEALSDFTRSLLPAGGRLAPLRRRYAAAKASRLQSDWTSVSTSENRVLRMDLRTLRARAREQARNNGIFKALLRKARTNVIGRGIRLQCRAAFAKGTMNTRLNRRVEDLFTEWGRRENCTMSGRMTWTDCQKAFVTRLLRDGEVLVQKVEEPQNKFGFALHFIDADYLDENFNELTPSGNRIIMSVEVDRWGRPAAYWLTPPRYNIVVPERNEPVERKRVPADQIIHSFLSYDDPDATRGKTAFHAALLDAKDLQGYKVGVISSARAAAYSFGMLVPPQDESDEYSGDGAQPQMEVALEPLTIQEIPPGYDFKQFDPKQPTQNHAQFYKSILMDLATSLDMHYFSLSGDLEAVNYSSARVGLLDERDVWRDLQDFVAENFCREVFRAWLIPVWLRGMITDQERSLVAEPVWQPRGWAWVDPAKEVRGKIDALSNHLTSLTETLAEEGKDIEEHFQTIQNERELAARYGIELEYGKAGEAKKDDGKEEPQDSPPEDEPAAPPAKPRGRRKK